MADGAGSPDASACSSVDDGGGGWRRSRWTALAVVSAALFLNWYAYSAAIPILPAIARAAHHSQQATDTNQAFLFGCYAAGFLVATPVFGVLSDRSAERRVPLAVGQALMAASSVTIVLLQTHYAAVALCRFMHGVASAGTWAIGMALLSDVFPRCEFSLASGVAYGVAAIGDLSGFLVGGFLGYYYGTACPFLLLAAASSLNCVLSLVLQPVLSRHAAAAQATVGHNYPAAEVGIDAAYNSRPLAQSAADLSLANRSGLNGRRMMHSAPNLSQPAEKRAVVYWRSAETEHTAETRPVSMWMLLRRRRVALTLGVEFLLSAADSAIEAFVPLWFDDVWALPSTVASVVLVAECVPKIALSPLFGWATPTFGRQRAVCAAGLACAGAAIAGMPYATHWLLELMPALALFGASYAAASTPVCPLVSGDAARVAGGAASYGQLFSLVNMAHASGMLAGPWAVGFVKWRVAALRPHALDAAAGVLGALRGPFAARLPLIVAHVGLVGAFVLVGTVCVLYASLFFLAMSLPAQ